MPLYTEVPVLVRDDGVVMSTAFAPDPLDTISVELDGYYRLLTTLNSMASTEVFQTLSAISARASEIRHRLISLDARRPTALRTKHVDPLLDEVDRQFKIHSRIQAVRQMEWDASKGGI